MSNALSEKRLAPPTWQAVLTNPQWRPYANGALTMGPCCQEGGFLQRNFCQGTHVEPGWEPSRALWMTCASRELLAATWNKFFFSSSRRRLSILLLSSSSGRVTIVWITSKFLANGPLTAEHWRDHRLYMHRLSFHELTISLRAINYSKEKDHRLLMKI